LAQLPVDVCEIAHAAAVMLRGLSEGNELRVGDRSEN
jgi:hypothetical protein